MTAAKGYNSLDKPTGCNCAQDAAGKRSVSSIVDWPRPAIVWLALVIAAVAWQPFLLGFYADDWTLIVEAARHGRAFGLERLAFAYSINPARPAMFPFWYVLSSALGDNALLWQIGLVVVNGLIVVILATLIGFLTGNRTPAGRAISWSCAAVWMILPTNASFHFWPTSVPVVATLAMFGLLVLMIVRVVDRCTPTRPERYCGIALFYGSICISYEAFFFQWFPIIVIAGALCVARKRPRKEVIKACSALFAGQALAVGWYFLAKRVTAMEKPIVMDWPAVCWRNLRAVAPEIGRSTEETLAWVAICSLIVFALALFAIVKSLFGGRKDRSEVYLRTSIVFALALGAVGSVVAFSLGGRFVVGTGVEARTFLMIDFWGVLGLGVVVGWLESRVSIRYFRAFFGALLLGLAGLTVSHVQRAFDWISGWTLAKQIIAEAPVGLLLATEPDSLVALVAHRELNGGPVFLQSYELETALKLIHPILRGRSVVIFNPSLGELSWDGRRLEYPAFPGTVAFPEAQKLYVWIPGRHEFWSAAGKVRIRQDLAVIGERGSMPDLPRFVY